MLITLKLKPFKCKSTLDDYPIVKFSHWEQATATE